MAADPYFDKTVLLLPLGSDFLGRSVLNNQVTSYGNTGSSQTGSATLNTYGPYKGYIHDVRITKGVARYTEDFTPPGSLLGRVYGLKDQTATYHLINERSGAMSVLSPSTSEQFQFDYLTYEPHQALRYKEDGCINIIKNVVPVDYQSDI